MGGAANPRGHPSGIKGEVPALTYDPEREDSNSKMEPSELLSKTPPKIRLTQTVMHSQASSHVGKQNYGTKSVHYSIQKRPRQFIQAEQGTASYLRLLWM